MVKTLEFDPTWQFEITADTYRANISYVEQDLAFMLREQRFPAKTTHIDTYGAQWLLAFAVPTHVQGFIRSGRRLISMQGPVAVFVPPFSIVEWHLSVGVLDWLSFTSPTALPEDVPKQPVVFKWNGMLPQTKNEIFKMIATAQDPILITQGRVHSEVALRVKKHIDESYHEEMRIQDLAKELGMSRFALTREFSKMFGISPIDYRTRLRIFEALKIMTFTDNVTQAAYQSGFSNLSRFFDQFRKFISTTPSECNPIKNGWKKIGPCKLLSELS